MSELEFDWNGCYTGAASDHEPPDPLVLEIVGREPPGRALDVGCGAGGLVIALAARGWQVTGIDLAANAIAATRAVAATRELEVDVEVADATSWKPTGAYQLITSTFALPGTVQERARVFAMAREALAPGGLIVLVDFDSTMASTHEIFSTYDCPTVDELTGAFAGFAIDRAEVVETPPHDHDGSGAHAGERWTAALLVARKPA